MTRKLGSPVLTTSSPLTRPTSSAPASESSSAGQTPSPAWPISSAVTRRARDGDHADRQVELAGDQQQRDRDAADAQRRGDVQHGGQRRRELSRPGACSAKNDDDQTSADAARRQARPGQRPSEQPAAAAALPVGAAPERRQAVGDHRRGRPGRRRDVGSGASSAAAVCPVSTIGGPARATAA